MVKVCGRCKFEEKHRDWNDFPAAKHYFFKIMLVKFEQQLRIPRKFVDCFRGKLSKHCSLIGPSGNKWRVTIEQTQEDVVFSQGWECFVRDHGLKMYDFLVFHYADSSSFKVMIFDASGCELEGSHFAKNQSSCLQTACASTLHTCRNDEMLESNQEMDISMEEIGSDEQDSGASSEGKRRARNKGKGKKIKKEEFDMSGDEESREEDSFYEEALQFKVKKKRGESSQGTLTHTRASTHI